MINKRLINTGEAAPAAFDPLQNFETVTYTGNGGTQKITGYIRKGAAFNGSSSKIDLSNSLTYGASTTYSISLWVNPSSFNVRLLGNMGAGGSVQENQMFAYISSSGALNYGIVQSGSTTSSDIISNESFTLNVWNHIVYVVNAGTITPYINGVAATVNTSGISSTVSYTDIQLGTYGNLTSNMFNGKIDQVRIFDKALSSGEVTTLYGETYASSTKSTTDIFNDGSGVALYELDEDANDTGGTYNGTPTNVNFLGMAFQPDLVWIKSRSNAYNHYWYDSIRGANNQLISNSTDAEATVLNRMTSFDTNGFTVEAAGAFPDQTNGNGLTYVAWCWKAGGTAVSNTDGNVTTTISANVDAGFSIVSLSKTDLNTRNYGHGLSSAPELIILKRTASADDWYVYHKDLGNTVRISLNSNAAQVTGTGVWGSTTPTDSVFTLQNQSGGAHIAYCFHSVSGYQKVGSYSGGSTGSGAEISVGFEPRFVMIKKIDSYLGNANWWMWDNIRNPSSPYGLQPNLNNAEATDDLIRFTSTGFYFVSTNGEINNSGSTFIYLAIA